MLQNWLRELIHPSFFQAGPLGLMWWQWLALPALAIVALGVGRLLGGVTRGVLHRWFRRTAITWDDRLLDRTGAAVTILWSLAAFRLLLPWLDLPADSQSSVHRVLAAGVVVGMFWALWRSVDVLVEALRSRAWAADSPSAISMIQVGGNLAKAMVAVGGFLTTLSVFGYPVSTALAGLGIGGVALAFGAQKTVENLFGSVSLAADQPCRVGDFIRVDALIGHVENIGTRSTRIRTLDRTLVTIPNGRFADMQIETFAVRDRIRFLTNVGLVYGTTESQITQVLAGIEQMLRSHPKIWPDTVVTRFSGFGSSSLDIEVLCWFETSDFNEFRDCRQDALLGIMRVVEAAGTSFAFPTQTVHLAGSAAPPARP